MLEGRYNLPERNADDDGYTPYQTGVSAAEAKQNTLRYLRNIGRMVAGRDDVQVKIVPKGKHIGFTNGSVIYIRNGDFTNPDYLKLVNGIIDHEAGHVKHSDFAYLNSLQLTPLQLSLFNTIEDVRMEQCVKRDFPGSVQNLQAMCQLLVERGGADYHSQAFPVMFQGYVMLYCRAHFNDDACMHEPMLVTRNALVDVMGHEFLHQMEVILQKVGLITEMFEVLPVVDELIHLLEQHRDQAESTDDQGNDTESKSASTEVSENPGQNKVSSVPAQNSDPCNIPENEVQSPAKSSGQDLPEKPKTSLSRNQLIERLFASSEDDFSPDLHDQARELMESMAEQAARGNQIDHFLTDRRYIMNPSLDKAYFDLGASHTHFRQLAPSVKKAFFSMLPKPGEYRSRGSRLAPERFAHALAGRSAVFKDEPIRRQSVANVHIAVDCSESMAGLGDAATSPMLVANNAVFALASALYQLPKTRVQVDYFSSVREVMFYRACAFGKPPLSAAFGLKPAGSTPTASAIKEGIYELCHNHRHPAERNYLILITDGEPYDRKTPEGGVNINRMLDMARATGVRVFCIAIAHEEQQVIYYQAGFKPHECVFIQSAGNLAKAFEQVVRTGIFTQ